MIRRPDDRESYEEPRVSLDPLAPSEGFLDRLEAAARELAREERSTFDADVTRAARWFLPAAVAIVASVLLVSRQKPPPPPKAASLLVGSDSAELLLYSTEEHR